MHESEDLKLIFRLCYDPYIRFHITRVIISERDAPHWVKENYNMDDLVEDLDKLVQREITGNAALEHVENIYWSLPIDFRPYLEKILQKDLKIGAATGLVNGVWPDWIPEFKLGLCERFKKIKTQNIKYPVIAEPKIDGVRSLAFIDRDDDGLLQVIIKARSGLIFNNFKNIENSIRELAIQDHRLIGQILDGEIQDSNFQSTMSNARREHDIQFDNADFYIWDIIPIDQFENEAPTDALNLRKSLLFEVLADSIKEVGQIPYLKSYQVSFDGKPIDYYNKKLNLYMLPWFTADSFVEIIKLYELFKSNGDEGIIVKNLDSSYQYSAGSKRGGQNAPWWKFKVQDYDALHGLNTGSEFTVQITNYERGDKRTKYKDSLGSFYYRGFAEFEGKKVEITGKCGGGFKDDQRKDFLQRGDSLIGKIMDVVSQEVTKNKYGEYSLRFPIFKGFREDLTKIDVN